MASKYKEHFNDTPSLEIDRSELYWTDLLKTRPLLDIINDLFIAFWLHKNTFIIREAKETVASLFDILKPIPAVVQKVREMLSLHAKERGERDLSRDKKMADQENQLFLFFEEVTRKHIS